MENVNLLCSIFTKKADVKKHTGYRLPSVPQFFSFRRHRTEFVRKMRSRIFRQIVQKFRRHTVGRNQS